MIFVGIVLAFLDILDQGVGSLVGLSISVIFLSIVSYMLFRIKLIGGADAKAIIALSVLIPNFPLTPLKGIPFLNLFVPSVFGNAVLLMLILPPMLFFYNLTHLSRDEVKQDFFHSFLGYKSDISEIKNSHIKLIESYNEQDGTIIKRFVPRGADVDNRTVRRMQQLAKDKKIPDKVWVTPDIPFMIPLTLGFIIALVYGDLMYLVVLHLV